MATPSVFFGVSNYHSERWDRRQIFNRQAITGVNTVPLHLLQIQGTVTAHTGALLTQWNRLGTPSGGQTDCFRIWTTWCCKAAIQHRPDLYEAFIANTGSLYHKHMPAHEIRPQKNPNYLTRTKSFPGVHLYLLPRLGMCGAVFLVSLYFFMAWTSTTLPLTACLFHLGNKAPGCNNSRIFEMERKISNWSKGAL